MNLTRLGCRFGPNRLASLTTSSAAIITVSRLAPRKICKSERIQPFKRFVAAPSQK